MTDDKRKWQRDFDEYFDDERNERVVYVREQPARSSAQELASAGARFINVIAGILAIAFFGFMLILCGSFMYTWAVSPPF